MAVVDFSSRSIQSLADEYVRSGKARSSAISTFAAIRAIRTVMPDCPHSDTELATIIAEKAVFHGCAVFFDDVIRSANKH